MAALVTAALLWGASTSLTKYVLGVFPPITLLVIELMLANLVLWPLVALRRRLRPRAAATPEAAPVRVTWRRLALLGLLEPALSYGALTIGLAATNAANASLLGSFEAPFAVLLAALLLRERLTRRRVAGLVLAVAGVAVLDGARDLFSLSIGDLLILGGALTTALYTLLARRIAGDMDALEMTACQFGFGLLFTVPIWAVLYATGLERLSAPIEPRHWAVVVLTCCTEFIVSFLLFNFAVRAIPAGVAAMTLNLVPVFGVLAAIVLLREPISTGQAVGAVFIVGGMLTFSGEDAVARTSGRIVAARSITK